jgi:hypothetical protein
MNTLHRFETLRLSRDSHASARGSGFALPAAVRCTVAEKRAVSLLLVLNSLIYVHLCLRIGGVL